MNTLQFKIRTLSEEEHLESDLELTMEELNKKLKRLAWFGVQLGKTIPGKAKILKYYLFWWLNI